MKLLALSATVGALGAAAFLHAPSASANGPIPVVDESASICNTLSLVDAGYTEWNNIEISMLQSMYDATRGEAVYAMQAAAESFCPEYAHVVPVR
ncbi:hypothetical protein SEA_NOSHOW_63 [Mycobacterium phage NoShow]|nr:hypothetical protein SEA_NOSHOW_63 [Mycobacterium phage NoShow]